MVDSNLQDVLAELWSMVPLFLLQPGQQTTQFSSL